MTDHIRRRLRITGHVQGVFFRASTQRHARNAGAVGWVRNCPDGSVEVEVEGSADALRAVEGFVRSGPPQARVQRVDCDELEPLGTERDFEVR